MKLSEALIIRGDLQKNISQIESRLQANAQIQEGGVLAEKPEELFSKLAKILTEFQELVQKINHTNLVSKDSDGKSISELITKRDVMDLEIRILRHFLDRASNLVQHYTKSEIRIFPSVDVTNYRKNLDNLSKKRRELEAKIQELN